MKSHELQDKFFKIECLVEDGPSGSARAIRQLAKEGYDALSTPLEDTIEIVVSAALMLNDKLPAKALTATIMQAFRGKANPRYIEQEIYRQKRIKA